MTDWEKLKVIELKEELKSRAVPLTGLKLKQQFIDKLVELDSQKPDGGVEDGGEAVNEDGADEGRKTAGVSAPDEDAATSNGIIGMGGQPSEQETAPKDDGSGKEARIVSKDPKEEDTQTIKPLPVLSPTREPESAAPVMPNEPSESNEPVPIPEQDTKMQDVGIEETSNMREEDKVDYKLPPYDGKLPDVKNQPPPSEVQNTVQGLLDHSEVAHTAGDSSKVPVMEVLEEQRKRKRRSPSPAPDMEEIKKKAKMNDGEASATRRESDALQAIKAATAEVQDGRAPNDPNEEPIRPMEASNDPDHTRVAKDVGGLPDAPELQEPVSTSESTVQQAENVESPEPSRYIAPAIHRATSSIYIRNFKRPLHIPTLRSYISDIAKSPSDPDTDAVKTFYLDVIRTHAFIRFTTISAASRVRNAMHETRFPDEQMRDPLWIDFIPDENVQAWIDQETGSTNGGFGGGRSSGRKYEVVYEKTRDGVEAILRDSSESNMKPSFQQQRSSRLSQDHTAVGSIASGIHPDRSGLVQSSTRDRDRDRQAKPSQPQDPPAPSKSDAGKGFKALDELFSSTTTKPKLYYKAVPQSIANNRLDMLQDLTTGHNDTGRSGDGGMKRYTFEDHRGRERWVDKGPEFGFGRKGQERLEGFRGRGRGSGGFRGRVRGGDSWRGGR